MGGRVTKWDTGAGARAEVALAGGTEDMKNDNR